MRTPLSSPADTGRRGRHRFVKAMAVLFALGTAVGIAAPAGAEVSGGCTASLAGQDVSPRSSTKASDAIDVNPTDQIVASSTSPAAIDGYKVQLEMGGFKWTIAKGAASGNSWSRAVSVSKYASHGVGLYKVIGSSTGAGACTGAVLVNVKGKSPLSTTAGLVGMAMTGIGGAGLVASAVRAVRKGAAVSASPVMAMLTMPAMMLVGMGVSGPMPISSTARRGWRPRLSVLGLVSGAIGGLGVIVLLQQYAVAYPTRGLALTGIVGGALLSLLTTNLPAFLLRGRANGAVTTEGAALTEESVATASAADAIEEPSATVDLTAEPETAPSWMPTHLVPASGLPAYSEPDDAADVPADKLDPGLEVAVIEESGHWAHVRCSNGWSAWVDGPQLVAMSQ